MRGGLEETRRALARAGDAAATVARMVRLVECRAPAIIVDAERDRLREAMLRLDADDALRAAALDALRRSP